MSSSTAETSGGIRQFSGESEDGKEYRRWRLWISNKLLTLDKLPAEAKGAYVFTLLTGKALEAVEHLEPSSYQCKDGEKAIFKVLDRRFPEKDQSDELAEVLNDIFNMKVKDGENIRTWISRATELFEKCERKSGCKFPDEARGYMVLKGSGLSDEQQAVVKGRALGEFKLETISRAMRSVYPDFVHRKRTAVALVEDEPDLDSTGTWQSDEVQGFADVEAFITEHHPDLPTAQGETAEMFPESDVAEILAATWKEKRAELNKLQRQRRFTEAKEAKRSFRIQVEELKARTKCNRCGRTGHWARECRQGRESGSSASNPSAKGKGKELGASYVEETVTAKPTIDVNLVEPEQSQSSELHFVASVFAEPTMLHQLMSSVDVEHQSEVHEVFLVSSPGFGILDSGCGKTIIGARTLEKFKQIWNEKGIAHPQIKHEINVFKFGNGHREVSEMCTALPVGIGGRRGTINAAIVKGDAPLLISRPAMKVLQANLSFSDDSLTMFADRLRVPVTLNAAGQYSVNVLDFPEPSASVTMQSPIEVPTVPQADQLNAPHDQFPNDRTPSPTPLDKPAEECQLPTSNEVLSASRKAGGITKKQLRSLHAQVKKGCKPLGQKYLIAEVFCPPRLTPQVEKAGFRGLSLDIKQGWDLTDPKIQDWVERELDTYPPELLLLCPPCTDAGGWFHLNSCFMTMQEVLQRKLKFRKYLKFCKRLMRNQLRHGGRVLFEHPRGSEVWDDPDMKAWCDEMHTFLLDMCCYNLHVPASIKGPKQLIKKSTRLLVSHEDMLSLHKLCPGEAHGQHAVIAGSHPTIGSVSKHAGHYTPEFVRAILRTLPSLKTAEVLVVDEELLCYQQLCSEVLAAEKEEVSEDNMKAVLLKLHKNLGHPSSDEFVRVLKHGQASSRALELARQLSCPQCEASKKPSTPLPAQVNRVTDFGHRVGLDVKFLPGWKVNQKVKALNVVDMATSFQIVIPFFETETSQLLHRLFCDHWCSWAGFPREVVMDPARTNLGKNYTEPLEAVGVHVSLTAAGAHWQLGKTEVHGGLFCHVLERVLQEKSPQNQVEWLQAVSQCHVKNSTIQTYGFSPCQLVFGRNPSLPGDLLEEPLNVISATSPLMEESISNACALRAAARKALLELQDSKSMRRAMIARPRVSRNFQAGDIVAYWRDQKWNQGAEAQIEAFGRAVQQESDAQSSESQPSSNNEPQIEQQQPDQAIDKSPMDVMPDVNVDNQQPPASGVEPSASEAVDKSASPADNSYGPIRRTRVPSKSGPLSLYRPTPTKQDDFIEIMQEVLPQLIEDATHGVKRSADGAAESSESKVPKTDAEHAVHFVQHEVSIEDARQWWNDLQNGVPHEVLIAQFMQKRAQKELHHSNNPPLIQAQVNAAKVTEWNTLLGKEAVRLVPPSKAKWIKEHQADRIMGSRFVITKKALEDVIENGVIPQVDNPEHWKVKARFCLQGHLDPDLSSKAEAGLLQSPTLSQMGRTVLFQLLATFRWVMQLGDVQGAFLEAGPIPAQYRPLYAWLPPGGLPGAEEYELVEVLGNIYGQNNAPAAWYHVFDEEVRSTGFKRSKYDPCLYFMHDQNGRLCGVLGSHVDDTATGGSGPEYERALQMLKTRFPYRKWRTGEGEFCGAHYKQNSTDMSIQLTMKGFAEGIRPAFLPSSRRAKRTAVLDKKEVSVLRAVNGSLNWLSSQSRPDLAAQTSLSQQAFPNPTVHHLCEANNVIRRAKQHSDLGVTFLPIPAEKLRLVCHSDAAFANVGDYTQAGFMIGFTSCDLDEGRQAPWVPAVWKSHRLSRAVGSTLAAEAQSMVNATGTLEWMSLLLSEAIDGPFDVRNYEAVLSLRKPVVVTDCKSLYDHLISMSSPTSVEDRRTSIDIVILRQSMLRMQASVRWVPTNRMIADSLTKNAGDPTDLLRACMREGQYQISPETTVLEMQNQEKQRRLANRKNSGQN
eukprot:s362_g18.t1